MCKDMKTKPVANNARLNNYKVEVTPEQSSKIQKLAIELGYAWVSEGMVKHTPYLGLSLSIGGVIQGYDSQSEFNKCPYEPISAPSLVAKLELLCEAKYLPIPKQAVPRFKVGDKVYLLNKPTIRTVKAVKGDLLELTDGAFTVFATDCTPATFENYERLQALFVDVTFENPKLVVPTGSDLCRAIVASSRPLVPCFVSKVSDEKAIEHGEKRNTDYIVFICKINDNFFVDTSGCCWSFAVPFDPITLQPLTAEQANLT